MKLKILFLFIALTFLSSCGGNILEFLHIDNNKNFDECMSKANAAYNRQDYTESKKWYGMAVSIRPDNSDARYGLAKSITRLNNIDIFSIGTGIIENENQEDILSGFSSEKITQIYNGTKDAQPHTKFIIEGKCTSGRIKPADIYWDHAFITSMAIFSSIHKSVEEIGSIENIEIVETEDGFKVSGWENVSQETKNIIYSLIDDLDYVIEIMNLSSENEQNIREIADKLKNIQPL